MSLSSRWPRFNNSDFFGKVSAIHCCDYSFAAVDLFISLSNMESTNGKDNEASCAISVDSGIARLHSSAVPIVQPALNGKVINSNGSLTSISSHK